MIISNVLHLIKLNVMTKNASDVILINNAKIRIMLNAIKRNVYLVPKMSIAIRMKNAI